MRTGLLMVLGRLQEAADLAKEALAADPDNFGQSMLLLDCLLPSTAAARGHHHSLIPCVSGGPGNVADKLKGMQLTGQDDVDQARAAVQQVQAAAAAAGATSRGAELAGVELAYRQVLVAQQQGQQEQQRQQQLAEAMLGYFKSFGHLLSCAIDLRAYSRRLAASAAGWLAQALEQQVQQQQQEEAAAGSSSGGKEAVNRLRCYVCAEQVRGRHAPALLPCCTAACACLLLGPSKIF